MSTWEEVAADAPAFAERVKARFEAHVNKTIATLRQDGSPRISGIEAQFAGPDLTFGSMPDAVKLRDLRRDPRLALHSGSSDPDPDAPGSWEGDAKVSGTAVGIPRPSEEGPDGSFFRIDIAEVVLTYVDAAGEKLVVESWHEGSGHRVRSRR